VSRRLLVDDRRQTDPTGPLLEDFVRYMSDQVAVPEFTPGQARARRRRRRVRGGGRVLAVVCATVAVAAAIALVVAYGPRSSRIGPGPTAVTQPPPGSTSTSTSTSSVAVGTQQITYQPFTTTGIDPDLVVTSQVAGTCIRYSRGADMRYYFRCFGTTHGVYDPCFAGPQGTRALLVCPTSPTSDDVVGFTVTSVTSDEPPTPSTIPWAMQLSSGQVCLLVSAAWSGLGPYGCQPGRAQPIVSDCHTPESSQPSWIAACQEQETAASPFTSETVTRVWF